MLTWYDRSEPRLCELFDVVRISLQPPSLKCLLDRTGSTGIDYSGLVGILVAGLPEVASGEVDDFTGGIPLPGPGLPPGDGLVV